MKRSVFLTTLIFLTLIFHNEVMSGTRSGLIVWYRMLIPALLPFIIITNALFETSSYKNLTCYFSNKSERAYILIAIIFGNLCGYPIGAKILNDFVSSQNINSNTANKLLSFSSQASPMFLLGFVYPMLPKKSLSIPVFLLLIYLPHIFLFYIYNFNQSDSDLKQNSNPEINYESDKHINISGTFIQAVNIMVVIGIYVIIFSIVLNILLPKSNNNLSKCLLAFMEITNGMNLINNLNISNTLRCCLLTTLSSFGGLCTAFQIKGVLLYEASSIKKYLMDKIIISSGTFILTFFYLKFN